MTDASQVSTVKILYASTEPWLCVSLLEKGFPATNKEMMVSNPGDEAKMMGRENLQASHPAMMSAISLKFSLVLSQYSNYREYDDAAS